MYLEHLSITGFRGVARPIQLPFSQRTILYGPNGSGKSSILQSIAWTVYGKLPAFSGGAFSREDALVNDFFRDGIAEVALTLSGGVTVTRKRSKQDSTTRGTKPPSLSFDTDDPQNAIERLLGLNYEEFFAGVFLHQETIRDFLTTTPDKRGATIDRMIGTHLLRTLIKLVDPRIPNKAIEETRLSIRNIETQLSQATVLNREILQQKKLQYGDPESLPQILELAIRNLSPSLEELALHIPVPTLADLSTGLSAARQRQLQSIGELTSQVEQLRNLGSRYRLASETNWLYVKEQKAKTGDPTEIPALLKSMSERLTPACRRLGLDQPTNKLLDLEESLAAAYKAQPTAVSQSMGRIATLNSLRDHYQQIVTVGRQNLFDRKARWGDPRTLPSLLDEIKSQLAPVLNELRLPLPPTSLQAVESSLKQARQKLPDTVRQLERRAGELLTLKDRYVRASQDVVEGLKIPPALIAQRQSLVDRRATLAGDLSSMTSRLAELRAREQLAQTLRTEVEGLPDLLTETRQLQEDIERREAASKQGELYNQILGLGQQYLEQAQPEHCPVCKKSIDNLNLLLSELHNEIPADVERLRREYNALTQQLAQKQTRASELEAKQKQLTSLDSSQDVFPDDLEGLIQQKQEQANQVDIDLARVNTDMAELEMRIRLMNEKRRILQQVVRDINTEIGDVKESDLPGALEDAASATRAKSASLGEFDFQPIDEMISRAKQIQELAQEEAHLHSQTQEVLASIRKVAGPFAEENVPVTLDKKVELLEIEVSEIQGLDLESITIDLARARQLQQIQDTELSLHKEQKVVETEIRQALHLPPEETDLQGNLEQAIRSMQERLDRVQSIDLGPAETLLERAEQINRIRQDEIQLRQMENNYQTANREKARLDHRIGRLSELRDALLDIAETTKQHQETIVTGVLNSLDINRYYSQLDPHPAYTDLQIEPELTDRGTYSYWIKALTADYLHGTHVQTRFSTAQANCAAIAIFLAVNQHLSRNLETIILDDPSQSMDEDHKYRLARTLAVNPRQVIVATEDQEMRRFLEDAFENPLVYELGTWSPEGTRTA